MKERKGKPRWHPKPVHRVGLTEEQMQGLVRSYDKEPTTSGEGGSEALGKLQGTIGCTSSQPTKLRQPKTISHGRPKQPVLGV
jgi:hypothetical protein